MSRVAVFETLASDEGLNSLGIQEDRIYPNWAEEERPIPDGPFLILRWGLISDTHWNTVKDVQFLTIWAHFPIEITNDFSMVENLLDACDAALRDMWDIVGADGYTVTCVRVRGRGQDTKDEGFQTITKTASYEVLWRITNA